MPANANIESLIADFCDEAKYTKQPLHEVVVSFIENNDIEPSEFLKNLDDAFIDRIKASFIDMYPRITKISGDTLFNKFDINLLFSGD